MKTIRIIPMMALLAIFACSANSSQKPTGVATTEGTASSAEVADNINTPTDVRCFGLLGDVKEVRLSPRLTDSVGCLVADEGAMNATMMRMMKAMGQEVPKQLRTLELNPDHPLVKQLAGGGGVRL